MNEFNHFLYHLDPATVATDRSVLPFEEFLLIELITEFGNSTLAIFEKPVAGNYIYLPKVDLLYFALSLEHAVNTLRTEPVSSFDLMSLYQYYSLRIELNEENVSIKDVFSNAIVRFKLGHFRKIARSFKIQVWNEFLLAFPEMRKSKDFKDVDKRFK